MNKETDELSRERKEKGFKVYKGILNVFAIIVLILLYRSVFITHNGGEWVYGGALFYYILRLYGLNKRERKAMELNIPVTEYMELKNEELKNKNKE